MKRPNRLHAGTKLGPNRRGDRHAVELRFESCAGLPRLAWGAVILKERGDVTVYHGEQVEVRENWFFEGAWNGPVDVASAMAATVMCGSGGACDHDGVCFWADTENTYPINSIHRKGKLFVSNSLMFVQVMAGEEPDLSYPFYFDDFIRIARKGFTVGGKLRTASGKRMRLHFGHVMTVDRELRISFRRHPPCAPFADYESYYRMLSSSVERVLENAASRKRSFTYKPLACCSAGYDANACAALAARAGCDEAVSIVDFGQDDGDLDNGEGIAGALNLHCMVRDRNLFRQASDLSEFCIVAHSMGSAYKIFEDVLGSRLLIAGYGGDTLWGLVMPRLYDDNRAGWLRFHSGYGLCEYRLRVGFLLLPPARIGSIYNRVIHAISNSDEMKPWRIGGKYDRPVPRRILEDAGVDRRAFGKDKKAGAQVRFDGPGMQEGETGRRYRQFMESRHSRAGALQEPYWKFRYRWRHFLLNSFAHRRMRVVRYNRVRQLFSFLSNRPAPYDWYYLFGFRFSFEALKGRYTAYIRSRVDPPGERSFADTKKAALRRPW